jgi:hypothetical protein
VAGFDRFLIVQIGVNTTPERTKDVKVVELAMVSMASLVLSAMSLFSHMADRLNSLLEVYANGRRYTIYLICQRL